MLLHDAAGIRYERWNVKCEWWHELSKVTRVKVDRAHLDVVRCVVVFGKVVGEVVFAWCPLDGQLVLVNSVRDPVEPHVHSFGSLELMLAVGKSTGCGVISDDSGWSGLGMAHFPEDFPDENCFLSIVEESSYLSFGG